VIEPGINGKMNEIQAAYGLIQLKHINEYIAKRKTISDLYKHKLSNIEGLRFLGDIDWINHSYTYFPILIDVRKYKETRDEVYERLKRYNIYGRRYFYPLISQFPTYRSLPSAVKENIPVATKVAEQVICLPIYPGLDKEDVLRICSVLTKHN
jgi:dTDP-4-amino-4,6-dideoxygalactose transaminase